MLEKTLALTVLCLIAAPIASVSAAAPQQSLVLAVDSTVEGPVELSPNAADAAAIEVAAEQVRGELLGKAVGLARRVKQIWVPELVADQLARDWVARQEPMRLVEVTDRARVVKDHGSFTSYRTNLELRPLERVLERGLHGLAGEVQRRGLALGAFAGGTLGLWLLLTLVYGWLDRITRGYMPWRLRVLCGGMGVALPGIALLLIQEFVR
ncbi:MAG: hypothetical protein AB7I19_06595 [Planctomycetota bacterium]